LSGVEPHVQTGVMWAGAMPYSDYYREGNGRISGGICAQPFSGPACRELATSGGLFGGPERILPGAYSWVWVWRVAGSAVDSAGAGAGAGAGVGVFTVHAEWCLLLP
jgi:hypothetical protein